MLKWILFLASFFLLAEHMYIHYGTTAINYVASRMMGERVELVKEPFRKESAIDILIKQVRSTVDKVRGGRK